jgi:hypothetical protein
MAEDVITIRLSPDQALVLSDFFFRFQESDQLAFAHPAEFYALSAVAGQIESSLVEPLRPDYNALVAAARHRLAGDHEGDYPGPKIQKS